MGTSYSISEYFGANLAHLLSDKIVQVDEKFDAPEFITSIEKHCSGKTYTQRIELFSDELNRFLPPDYPEAIAILLDIIGEENSEETGMFSNFYWIMPIGKFIEKYGLEHYDISISAIGEITKRNTGEYAIRPFIRKYPEKTLKQMKIWAQSDNFHLRRLASEGLRPKLPWAKKLEIFIDNPSPVFEILDILKEDPVNFVKKSVANHLTDWLKVNPDPTFAFIRGWSTSDNKHTQWIIRRATRKHPIPEL